MTRRTVREQSGTTSIPWYVSLFGEEYFDIYGTLLPDERTTREVEGIEKLLALPPRSHILDLACGHGRHAIPLAEHGYQVTGQDLSEVFLERARADAQARGVQVNWVHGDMRELPFVAEFDAIINIFTAFGYFDSDAENQQVLHQVHRALRPGGRFLLELMHRDALVRGFQPFGVSRREDGLMVVEERRFDQCSGRSTVELTLIYPDGRRTELAHHTRVYTPTELIAMLSRSALEVEATYGGLDASALTLDSRRLVVLARKPALVVAGCRGRR
ncbi:MAG: class I SAM-dependent methyltransferase [Chloroflexi bacterium]|nr:class I SAM-dependent methyltransferase [Chloroflexota bacterium]